VLAIIRELVCEDLYFIWGGYSIVQ
jgi:hypothetical protein